MLYVTIKDFENYKTDQHWFLGGKTNWFGTGFQDLISSQLGLPIDAMAAWSRSLARSHIFALHTTLPVHTP